MEFQDSRSVGKLNSLNRNRRISTTALLVALALVMGYVESMVALPISIPGVKLGLGNICVLVALYLLDTKTALLVMVMKVAVSALLFGSPMALIYSVSGGTLSFIAMWLLKKSDLVNIVAISIVAAVLHNIAQVVVAVILFETLGLLVNLPILMVAACITGFLTGSVAMGVLKALEHAQESRNIFRPKNN
jgi:heptaprenyl diphosphate synthase